MDMQISQARLAKEVLEEIPEQFLSYMKVNNITPGSWLSPEERQRRADLASAPLAPSAAVGGFGYGTTQLPQPPMENFAKGVAIGDAPPPYPGY